MVGAACLAVTAALAVVVAAGAGADSFTPVRLSVRIARTARVHRALPVRVSVSADPGVLDDRTSPLRIEVKLADECGGTFAYTKGVTLLDKRLVPQPQTGRAYSASAAGSGRPRYRGSKTVCVWLVEQGDQRMFAFDDSHTVRVRRAARARTAGARAATTLPAVSPPPIRHVFLIVLENESVKTSFAANSPAPYLARTLRSEGAFLPRYYGVGHESNDNYIAMISGQPPNADNQADCQFYTDFAPLGTGAYGAQQGVGCIYPPGIQTIAGQLDRAGYTWRDYNEDMGNTPTREASVCGHPGVNSRDGTQSATAADQYAARHDPFVYFHSIIDDTTLCDTHVVNLNLLPHDLLRAADTPNYVFITPNLCHDGHDAKCANGQTGSLKAANSFLERWVPRITGSPAFREQNGLLLVAFDEASTSDASSCCGEIAGPGSPRPGITGPGGGDVGAVMLSPCIRPGTVSEQPYNHYTMLRSVEDIFGLAHLGFAQLPGERSFGSDVFTRRCDVPPSVRLRTAVRRRRGRRSIRVRWSASEPGSTFTVQERTGRGGAWRTLRPHTSSRHLTVSRVRAGREYGFRVRATNGVGITGGWRARSVRVSGPR